MTSENNMSPLSLQNEALRYIRNPNASIITSRRSLTVVRQDYSVRVVKGIVTRDWAIINALTEPLSLAELVTTLGYSQSDVSQSLTMLANCGAIVRGNSTALSRVLSSNAQAETKACARLVWGLCGTIQASALISLLPALKMKVADEIDVILTKSAAQFIQPNVVEYLGARVWSDEYVSYRDIPVPHMHLAEKADVLLILPASAHSIQKLASGACSDLLSLVATATRAPILLAPSMNPAMISSPAVSRNIQLLRNDGCFVVQTGIGTATSDAKRTPTFITAGLRDAGYIAAAVKAAIQESAHRE